MTHGLFHISVAQTSWEMSSCNLELRGDGDELGAVDHLARVLAEDGELLEGCLESGLDLVLVPCNTRYANQHGSCVTRALMSTYRRRTAIRKLSWRHERAAEITQYNVVSELFLVIGLPRSRIGDAALQQEEIRLHLGYQQFYACKIRSNVVIRFVT